MEDRWTMFKDERASAKKKSKKRKKKKDTTKGLGKGRKVKKPRKDDRKNKKTDKETARVKLTQDRGKGTQESPGKTGKGRHRKQTKSRDRDINKHSTKETDKERERRDESDRDQKNTAEMDKEKDQNNKDRDRDNKKRTDTRESVKEKNREGRQTNDGDQDWKGKDKDGDQDRKGKDKDGDQDRKGKDKDGEKNRESGQKSRENQARKTRDKNGKKTKEKNGEGSQKNGGDQDQKDKDKDEEKPKQTGTKTGAEKDGSSAAAQSKSTKATNLQIPKTVEWDKDEPAIVPSVPKTSSLEGEDAAKRNASVLLRLRAARARRLQQQRKKKQQQKKGVPGKSSAQTTRTKNTVEHLQALAKDAAAFGGVDWSATLRKQVQMMQCKIFADENTSLLLYFPPPCTATETPPQLLAADLPLAPAALADELDALQKQSAENEAVEHKAKIEEEMKSPTRIEELERDFHKIMTNVITLGDHPARMRGFLKLSQVPIEQLLLFKSKAYEGTTLLMQAAKHGHAISAVILIDEHSAPIDEQSLDTQDTALHLARSNGHHDVVNALLQRQANASLLNGSGASAFHEGEVIQARYTAKSKKHKNATIINIREDTHSGCVFRVRFTGFDDETDVPANRVSVSHTHKPDP